LFGFAFSFDHPGWAKGNFLICSVFFVRMKKLRGESHPLSLNSKYSFNPQIQQGTLMYG